MFEIFGADPGETAQDEQSPGNAAHLAQTLLRNVPVPLVILAPDLRIHAANAAFQEISGLEAADLSGQCFPDLLAHLWALQDIHVAMENAVAEDTDFELERVTRGDNPQILRLLGRPAVLASSKTLLVALENVTPAEHVKPPTHGGLQPGKQLHSAAFDLRRNLDELRALTAKLLRSQEEERRQIALELHDSVSQQLAILANEVERLRQNISADSGQLLTRLEHLRDRTGSLADEVRRISHKLHPSAIEDLGLPVALRGLVADFSEREGMPANFSHRNVPAKLPVEIALPLYRIAEEALRNVARHAGRTHVRVGLSATSAGLRLTVRDLGDGFDPAESRGSGIVAIEELSRLIGGTFRITSELGEGTTIHVDVPLPAANKAP